MKQNKFGFIILLVSLTVFLIVGIRNTMARAAEPEKSTFQQIMAPAAGGGPGAVPNWFTYQGYLEDDGAPINDTCDFQFSLWDSSGSGTPPAGGIQIGTTETVSSISVIDGLFSYPLNATGVFGDDAFNGQMRYLQIAVRCPAGGGAYTTLAPRQLLTASPYALSLRPGAVISDAQNNALLSVVNTFDSDTHGSAISAHGSSPTAPVIAAYHEGTGHALYGSSDSSYPTVGGVNYGSGSAIDGRSTSGNGVYGSTSSTDSVGVLGVQSGYTISDLSTYFKPGGFFGGRNGVVGIAKADAGFGVFGWDQSTSGGWAGYFLSTNGSGVYASVPAGHVGLNTNGTKPAVVATDDGARLMYAEEATEVWFTEYGFGQLVGGTAVITIDPTYAQTVNLAEPYHVFLQAYDDADLYVTNRTASSFEVQLREGNSSAEFSYRIVAARLGYEADRMEPAPWADNDPNLYPEKANNAAAMTQGGQ